MASFTDPGLKFWKVGSRKIFAVLESQLNRIKGKGRKRDVIHISESESDDELPPSKKGKHIPVQLDQLTLRRDERNPKRYQFSVNVE